ncbi:MAG TPA: OmpH family outer membrane protein [Polyangia bacterium]|jgi:Skp family chaperone for outer membrane proteins
MFRLRALAALALALALVTPVLASAKVRLGTLDMKKAFTTSRAGQGARDRLKKEFEAKQKKLDAAQEEIKKLLAQGQNETNAEKRDALGKQIEAKTRTLQELYKKLQRELDEAEKGATLKLVNQIKAMIPSVAQSMKLAAIAEGEGLYFADAEVEKVDITAEVIKRLDAKAK